MKICSMFWLDVLYDTPVIKFGNASDASAEVWIGGILVICVVCFEDLVSQWNFCCVMRNRGEINHILNFLSQDNCDIELKGWE